MFNEIQKALSPSIRGRIIECLSQRNASFSELQKYTTLEDHGNFGYHLRVLINMGLVKHNPSKNYYYLSEQGLVVAGLQLILKGITAQEKIEDTILQINNTGKKIYEEWIKVLDTISDYVFLIDKDYRIVRTNKAFCDLMKKKPRDLIGKHCYEVLHGTDKPLPNCPYKISLVTKEEEIEEINDPISGISLSVLVTPLFNEKDEVIGSIHIARDISKHKLLEEQLSNANRLAVIGEVAGMVGHDLRNPLQVILNTIYLVNMKIESLPSELAEKDEINKYVGTVRKQVMNMTQIVSSLLDSVRPLQPKPVEYNLYQLIDESLSTEVPETIETSIAIPDGYNVIIDPTLMRRVFINLITNAVHAMPDGGKLTIKTFEKSGDLFITIEDTGIGIPEENIPKLFLPLFTTKSAGMGFGLTISKRIIEAHGGDITVESKVGKGSTFTVKIPLKD